MKLIIFGSSFSPSAHDSVASSWRALVGALTAQHHHVTFYERADASDASSHDLIAAGAGQHRRYACFSDIRREAAEALREADAGLVTSSCPDALHAAELIKSSSVPARAFYDTTPLRTLAHLSRAETVPYIGPEGLQGFDVCLSYAGGEALDALQRNLGAVHAIPLFGCVDPEACRLQPALPEFHCELLYAGPDSDDHRECLKQLFLEPARLRPELSCARCGGQLPETYARLQNIKALACAPEQRSAMFSSARLCVELAEAGASNLVYCPTSALFEAGACAAAVITSFRPGLTQFYEPGEEVLVARCAEDVLQACSLSDRELHALGQRMRERTLAQHTSSMRARQLIQCLADACAGSRAFEREQADRIRPVGEH